MSTVRRETEAAFQRRVFAYLKKRGGFWVKFNAGPFGVVGVPYILGCYQGYFVAFELKQPNRYSDPKKGLTDAQARMGEQIIAVGGMWACVDSIEAIGAVLDAV